jgi:transposase
MLWSFLYLAVWRMFQLLVLRARSTKRKELEMLVLRHELAIARRQLGRARPSAADRALLAALSRSLPRPSWSAFSVSPKTILGWHRRLVARRWTYGNRPPGRPPLDRELEALIVRLARENPRWGYQRIVGELRKLGLRASATSVRSVLKRHGIPPAPRRAGPSWRAFLRAQGASMLACDFFTVDTVGLRRLYVLFFIELHSRRVRLAGCTSNPISSWVTQQARNLAFDLADEDRPVRFLVHDRDAKFSGAFDEVFRTEPVMIIRTPVKAPNANAHAERFIRTVRSDCLDWLLILGRRQLERVLREYVDHYNRAAPAPRARTASAPGFTKGRSVSTTKSVGRSPPRPARRVDPRVRARRLMKSEFLNPTRRPGARPSMAWISTTSRG